MMDTFEVVIGDKHEQRYQRVNDGHKADNMFNVEEAFVDVDRLLIVFFVATAVILSIVIFQCIIDGVLVCSFLQFDSMPKCLNWTQILNL